MPNAFTPAGRRNLLATSADEPVLVCLEITHPELDVPIRVVNDTVNLTVIDVEYIACPFAITLPDDIAEQIPQATLSVDNIGRELTQWLEFSRGGKGAQCRILMVRPSAASEYVASDFGPYATDTFAEDYTLIVDRDSVNPYEMDMTLDMTGISIDNLSVSANLGYQSTSARSAVAVRYDPISSPGMF